MSSMRSIGRSPVPITPSGSPADGVARPSQAASTSPTPPTHASLSLIGSPLAPPSRHLGALTGHLERSSAELAPSRRVDSSVHPSVARGVLRNEAAITNATTRQHIVGTFGAAQGVIVAMYNPRTKTAALAHIDAGRGPGQVIGMLVGRLTQDGDSDALDVHLAGADISERNDTLLALKVMIAHQARLTVRSETSASSFAIDARDGKTHAHLDPRDMDYGDDMPMRQARHELDDYLATLGLPESALSLVFQPAPRDSRSTGR